MAEQRDPVLQSVFPDQQFQTLPLRPFPCNRTLKIEPTIAQSSTGANQKCMILHRMQASHSQQGEGTAQCHERPSREIPRSSGTSTPSRETTIFPGSIAGKCSRI